jgi:transcription elongation GreA/GreB family factor
MDFSIKKKLVELLQETLERDLTLLMNAAHVAHEAATHEESKAEDKYDTRGLEASYLAGAQARRAGEVQEMMHFYQALKLQKIEKGGVILAPALIRFENESKESVVLLVPKANLTTLELAGKSYPLMTSLSPLGQEFIGRSVGEDFEILLGGRKRAYVILDAV